MDQATVLAQLREKGDPENVAGMAHFGISPKTVVLGVRIPEVRQIAKTIKRDHTLAQELWATGIHEARILATIIADPKQTTSDLMDAWTNEFDTWDICDQACSNLYCRTPYAYDKVQKWSAHPQEFVKRAGIVLIAYLAVHDKKVSDEKLLAFMPILQREAGDERNFVKKGVSWALRQLGKRNLNLNQHAIATAKTIQHLDSKAAKWIATDVLKELTSQKLQDRLKDKVK